MTIFYLALAIISGLCMSLQSPTNATLSRHVGNLQATTISFGGGAICLAVLTFIIGTGDLSLLGEASWWQFFGGVYGVCIVLAITFAIPRLGAALTSTILMLGQISTGTVLDTFGFMELETVPLAPGRIIGCFIVLIGIILVYIGKKKQETGRNKEYNKQTAVVIICIFLAGIAGALQSPTNTALSRHIGSIESSFICFVVGFLFILVITLIANKGHFGTVTNKGAEWWMLLGGVYGATIVFINLISIPHLGSAFLLIAITLGQLTGGMLVDSFGLLRTAKIKMNSWRYTGMAVIAIGVIIVAITKM